MITDNNSCRVPLLLSDAVHGLDVEQRGLLRVEVVSEPPDPPEVRHPVEGHRAQGQQLASVVITPGQPEPVTGQVEVTNILTRNKYSTASGDLWLKIDAGFKVTQNTILKYGAAFLLF